MGTSNPTHSLDEIKFHTNLVVEPILVDEDQIRRTAVSSKRRMRSPLRTPKRASGRTASTRTWPSVERACILSSTRWFSFR
ncbi:hypothetical protein [Stenotrophomonas sp. 3diitr2024]|uniref:hypothetical protein n=1 Tax=Stenotrophomonas sp. 3diitr2024 TaxID=3345115 RepID=UPI0035CC2495